MIWFIMFIYKHLICLTVGKCFGHFFLFWTDLPKVTIHYAFTLINPFSFGRQTLLSAHSADPARAANHIGPEDSQERVVVVIRWPKVRLMHTANAA